MKTKTLTFVAVLFAVIQMSVVPQIFAQPIPTGVVIAQPSGVSTNSNMWVYWESDLVGPNQCRLKADFNQFGEVTSMTFSCGSQDKSTQREYNFPADNQNLAFKDLKKWIAFAKKTHGQFVLIRKDIYIDKVPYQYFRKSIGLSNFEFSEKLQILIFKRGEEFLAVPLSSWQGKYSFEKGEQVFIGRTSYGDYYFPAEFRDHEWFMSSEMVSRLKVIEEEAERFEPSRK